MTLANQIERLSAAATPGEWFYGIAYEPERGPVSFDYKSPGYYANTGIMAKGTTIAGCGEYHIFNNLADVDLMITLRNAVPQIIAALNAQAEVEALRATLKWYADQFCEYPDNEGCGKYEDGTCSGCRARKSLEAKP